MKRRPTKQELRRIASSVMDDTRRSGGQISRNELALLLIVVITGVALRLWALSQSAVEHFDEGVYASNIYFGPPDYAYPQQKFYAPPLLPALIEAGMLTGIPPSIAALLPSFLAGCATIAALWWIGRSWFGPAAGLSAATLVALSDFHIAYSTAALTDVLLGLWLVLAVDATGKSIVAGDLRWAVGAGIFTGLAWWTKYNGWLPLAIEGAALPAMWLALPQERARWPRWIGCFVVTAVVAIGVWCPYYFSLQASGGYGPIAANHAKYVVGISGWLDSAARQISNQFVIERLFSPLAVGLAFVLPGFLPGVSAGDRLRRCGVSLALIVLSFAWTSFVVVALGAAIGLARVAYRLLRNLAQDRLAWMVVGFVVLLVWFAGLLLATPLYAPYPRLTLPWLLAAWLAASLNQKQDLADCKLSNLSTLPTKWQLAILSALVCLCLIPALFFPGDFELWPEPERRGVMRIAQQIHSSHSENTNRAIYVYGEPAMYFQLRAAGEQLVAPVATLPTAAVQIDGTQAPTYLIAGPHSQTDMAFRDALAKSSNWRLVQRFDYQPSSLVWLDLQDPRTLQTLSEKPPHTFELYEFIPEQHTQQASN